MSMFYCGIFTNKHVRYMYTVFAFKDEWHLWPPPPGVDGLIYWRDLPNFIWEYTAAFKETVYPNSVYGDLELPKAWTTHVINFLRPKEKG
jgi:hypothetical protein